MVVKRNTTYLGGAFTSILTDYSDFEYIFTRAFLAVSFQSIMNYLHTKKERPRASLALSSYPSNLASLKVFT